jgi:hypothetical protein
MTAAGAWWRASIPDDQWQERAMKQGGCLCGKIRYTLEGSVLGEAVCHCRNCQRQTGSAFSVLIAIAAKSLKLTGEPARFVDRGDSGNEVFRFFCRDCGSPIYTELPQRSKVVFIKAGTLDDTSHLAPKTNVWCDSAWPVTLFSQDAIRVPRNPG